MTWQADSVDARKALTGKFLCFETNTFIEKKNGHMLAEWLCLLFSPLGIARPLLATGDPISWVVIG